VPLRIAAISFSNAAPLYWDFRSACVSPATFEVSYHLPSQCAHMLELGEADVATIPAAAYTRIPDLHIVPDLAIASRQAVCSILLVSKVPREQIRRVALDTSSMTSVALTKVLLAKWNVPVETYSPMPSGIETMLTEHDAALVIGDPALKIDRSRWTTYDLCEEWVRLTGASFVFAFWAIRPDAVARARQLSLADYLRASRDHGIEPANLATTAADWAPRIGLSQSDMLRYFTENLYYRLDESCLAGLRLFYQYASECGALPVAPPLRFL
jgi:chorismate dehydratase